VIVIFVNCEMKKQVIHMDANSHFRKQNELNGYRGIFFNTEPKPEKSFLLEFVEHINDPTWSTVCR
jgi:hypothetical protein